ncbi:1-aminocyclopropane-1-carboxylate oxidase homolog 1-like [Benincasa hispida]|uniref:1-aminocyclopropane-1-carboxylate oxidase homolog 1-like n=1 Tax=Benincasa hispida TaxID=102211 RepID=UPI0019015969|nr:1-aminocyclopropane-1-carboxylate oxidase homolog 1-like [Benincasa hispida]
MLHQDKNVVDGVDLTPAANDDEHFDRAAELKLFDDTKAGVKGLVDSGITQIPRIFYRPPDASESPAPGDIELSIPVIDLEGIDIDSSKRRDVVYKVREASEKWGFFQLVNHGVPVSVLDEMKNGTLRFYEQDTELKKQFYTRHNTKSIVYNSNFDLFTAPAANWRDTFLCFMAPNLPNPQDLPEICRDILFEYSKEMKKLGIMLFELLSEALGLNTNYLSDIECDRGLAVLCHYYPACPQPELTLGTTEHADNDFLTVLLQDDQIGVLQVLHQKKWVDVPPIPGALVVNIGDLLQLISNDRFKSVEHRVLSNREGPRVSIASFFGIGVYPTSQVYGPIKELLSELNPAKYSETTLKDFYFYHNNRGLNGTSALQHYRLGVDDEGNG